MKTNSEYIYLKYGVAINGNHVIASACTEEENLH